MNFNVKSKLVAGAMAALSVTGLSVLSAPAAHAAGCGSDRVLASKPTDLYGNAFGIFSNKHLGKLYVGYIPSCRMAYAEVHWDKDLYLNMSDNKIWLQDAHGNKAGVADGNGSIIGNEYETSGLVPIDRFGYTYMQPRLHIGFTYSGQFKVPICRPTDYYGNGHNFSNGGNEASHNYQGCGY